MSTDSLTYRVTAAGSTDAADQAKRQARSAGYRVRTVARIDALTAMDPYLAPDDVAAGRRMWDVRLVVRS